RGQALTVLVTENPQQCYDPLARRSRACCRFLYFSFERASFLSALPSYLKFRFFLRLFTPTFGCSFVHLRFCFSVEVPLFVAVVICLSSSESCSLWRGCVLNNPSFDTSIVSTVTTVYFSSSIYSASWSTGAGSESEIPFHSSS